MRMGEKVKSGCVVTIKVLFRPFVAIWTTRRILETDRKKDKFWRRARNSPPLEIGFQRRLYSLRFPKANRFMVVLSQLF